MKKKHASSWETAEWTLLDAIKDGKAYTLESIRQRLFAQLGMGQFDELLADLVDFGAVEKVGATEGEPADGVKITQNGYNLLESLAGQHAANARRFPERWIREGDTVIEGNRSKHVIKVLGNEIRFSDGEIILDEVLAQALRKGRLRSAAILDVHRFSSAREWFNLVAAYDPEYQLPAELPEEAKELTFEELPPAYQDEVSEQFETLSTPEEEACQCIPPTAPVLKVEDPFSKAPPPNEIPTAPVGPDYSKENPFPTELRPELQNEVVDTVPVRENIPTIPQEQRAVPPMPDPVSQPSPEFMQQQDICPICHNVGLSQGCPLCHRKSPPATLPGVPLWNINNVQTLPENEEEVAIMQSLDELAEDLESSGNLEDAKLVDEAVLAYQIATAERG